MKQKSPGDRMWHWVLLPVGYALFVAGLISQHPGIFCASLFLDTVCVTVFLTVAFLSGRDEDLYHEVESQRNKLEYQVKELECEKQRLEKMLAAEAQITKRLDIG